MATRSFKRENDLQRACLDYCTKRPDIWVMNTVGGGTQKGGVPDLLLCYQGRFYGIELKKPKDSYGTTGRQKVVLRQIRKAGGVALTVNTYEDFIALFE